ncbi:histidine--tRNA ligase [Salinibacterium sp. SWN1162]|uniref:histidine--tRNA ligase n=1 Tax=Salinibacterium sp. SWN1162 TaxID=2792053 RepID=UPI0018CE499D|nr:histidine--tRNA ligase [Salinibacterium sp. SWN1162]MBH0010172.1 histidine--tRNA ligase [Salinibacterium sp. SWN1162]
MASTVNPPRGMRDFLPAEKAQRERVLGVIRSSYRAHGFDEIETPVMEDSSRLHAGLGGDNEKLAFAVMKRGLTAEKLQAASDALDLADLGMRFDLTVPLARFYATHRAELPKVFRSIQMAPVWRAERPQKGRYRQFVQCDIDIMGEAGPSAEIELITATAATLDALGVEGCTIRVNDRRLLTSSLTILGFPAKEHEAVLITVDKLDKLGADGVIAELRERAFPDAPVAALAEFLRRPAPETRPQFNADAIRAALPAGVTEEVILELAAIGHAVEAGRGDSGSLIEFDPWLVRGMGYYTGAIFEVAHPALGYSLGGGGRYDGMIGRFLGSDVPAVGFSLGFERLVDLVELGAATDDDQVALVYDADVEAATLVRLQAVLIKDGKRVRLEARPKKLPQLLDQLRDAGFTSFATVRAENVSIDSLEFKPLGG